MISSAIQQVISAIIPDTYQSIGDEKITTPYCIHEEVDTPEYLKEGLVGYSWNVEVAIIGDTPDAAESLAVSVRSAIEALEFTTNNDTVIETIEYTGGEPRFNKQTREYMKVLQFVIETKNR